MQELINCTALCHKINLISFTIYAYLVKKSVNSDDVVCFVMKVRVANAMIMIFLYNFTYIASHRIVKILPSTFAPYPESLLCQIFTGAAPAPISQVGYY